ncbi:CaiB/BaiF CoA transferase family protein [Ramlibacter tataouinensis]|uniref:Formyl-coenzyme A transferase (Formyl-CoA transferase)-like protein n=1 Tax=Ramlibacter tataouinensis (strain ATCC BAA-407 / DSM 14655 / LMG 21543 / TTB310) TaxID=365046 RepID=F5Y5M4_RAMTT|nr:CoA transferase [Ramlibacter tataouinensis]AEG92720.1 formyl-coenzyme A transferase (Formyl-CoA transferase)-like protein [Ramlibacter tataouinensis TTB310]
MGQAQGRPLPLAGVRVLDISQVMAGPYACMLLGDLGADVVKIEPPGTGDQTRGSMGFKMKGADSLGFLNMNRNKRSIVLDLKSEAGKSVLLRLVRDADILIENYRPGAMRRLGLGYEALREINPRLVYTSISGFGQTGPWSDRPGFDLMAQAMSGVMSVTGYPDSPPVKAGVPVADIGCALFAIYATLAAYIGARDTGQGQYVDAALFDSAMAFSVWDICDYWGTGQPPQPLGTANKMTAPYQAMASSDGHFVMGANNQKLWVQLCTLMGREELLQDARFSTIALRLAHRAELQDELEKTFRQKPKDHWVETLLANGIPAGPILSYPEAFGSEHAQARRMRMEIDHPVEGRVPNIGFAVKLSGTPQQVRRHPPLLGEHTAEVLEELGIGGEEQARLRAQGALGT